MLELPVLQSDAPPQRAPKPRFSERVRPQLLRLYRLAVLVAIVWIMREQAVWLRSQGEYPITLEEIRALLPAADRIDVDHSPRGGLFVLDEAGATIGYALRTSPTCDHMIGYCDMTDTLAVLDQEQQVVGIRIRRSGDTIAHAADVKDDEYFMTLWDGLDWNEIAGRTPRELEIEGVSGATMTSMNVAETLHTRFREALEQEAKPQPVQFGTRDAALIAVILIAIAMSFTRLRGWKWTRRAFQVALIGYIGLVNGDLIAQSLLMGWTTAGVAWHLAPGVALLVVAALVLPWATRRPVYCAQICPHGAAQELLGRVLPYKLRIPPHVARWLKQLPLVLLAAVLFAVMLQLPVDLASVEPFDAYVFRTAGWATIAIAGIGLLFALFVPQAYCKYGCPTGAVLEMVRSHGRADRFNGRDLTAALLLAMVFFMHWQHHLVTGWVIGHY